MEDPEKRDHLFQLIEWIGWDKLLFATDYPQEIRQRLQLRIAEPRGFFSGADDIDEEDGGERVFGPGVTAGGSAMPAGPR